MYHVETGTFIQVDQIKINQWQHHCHWLKASKWTGMITIILLYGIKGVHTLIHMKQQSLEQWGHSLASFSFSIQIKHRKTSAKLWKMNVIWTGKNEYGRLKIKYGERVKNEGAKSYKTIDSVSYALKLNENGVRCVFVVHFRSSDTFKRV